MPKHHPHPHGPRRHGPHHHGPAGLHQIASRLDEMRGRGATEDDIHAVLELLKDKLPRGFTGTSGEEGCDEALALATNAEGANLVALDVLRSSRVLIAGELRPHLVCSLLDEGVAALQVHDATPHGDRPPHFRDLAGWYPGQFTGVLSFTEINEDTVVTAILIDAFLDSKGVAHGSPLAMMAARLWPNAKIVAVLSDHRAPHHVGRVGRDVDHFLFWE